MSNNETGHFGEVTVNFEGIPDVLDFARGGDRAEEFIVRFDDEMANLMIDACKNEFRRLGGPAAKLDFATAKDAVFALLGLQIARQMSPGR